MSRNIPETLRKKVAARANYKYEYCGLPNDLSFFPHQIDHIIMAEALILTILPIPL